MALLALCGEKQDLSVKDVNLSAAAHDAVAEAFSSQEAAFREGEEKPFDQDWLNEGDEIAVSAIPESETVFHQINPSAATRSRDDQARPTTDTERAPVGPDDLEHIRGLAMTPKRGGERILVQSFAATQSLTRPWLVSLLYERGTYTRLESPAFRLNDRLVCIVEGGLIKFRSLYFLGRVIDTSAMFRAATDREVELFAEKHSILFDVADIPGFVDRANRNTRKYMASLATSQVLRNHTAETLQQASRGTHLKLEVRSGKILMPSRRREVTELFRFLNDGRYIGPISGRAFITNSRRPVT